MISRNMGRLPFYGFVNPAMTLEAFAVCYWAYYNALAIPTRVLVSQQLAWDFDSVQMVPRVVGGRPGYCICKWDDQGVQKIVVGIESMHSVGQLRTFFSGFGAARFPPLGGHIYAAMGTYAGIIFAELMANPFFTSLFSNSAAPLTLTGFSLGAGIAQVLLARFKLANPHSRVRAINFASPRVGSTFYSTTNLGLNNISNWYLENDPVSTIPYFTAVSASTISEDWILPFTYYQKNWNVGRIDFAGDQFNYQEEDSAVAYTRNVGALALPLLDNNQWRWHNIDKYRNALCGNAYSLTDDLHHRFRYMEYNDDNQWGQQYIPRSGLRPEMKIMAVPELAPFVVPLDLRQDAARAAQVHRADAPAEFFGGDGPGAGDWGAEGQIHLPKTLANPAWRPRQARNR